MMPKRTKIFSLLLWCALILALPGVMVLALLPPLPTQAGPGLPDRATPTPAPRPDRKDKDSPPPGAFIELQRQGAPAGAWTVVQWQDSAGNWHDVEGWQGTLDGGGSVRWWVSARDFGTGPFRWVVTQGPGSPVIGASESFTLPHQPNEVVRVVVQAN